MKNEAHLVKKFLKLGWRGRSSVSFLSGASICRFILKLRFLSNLEFYLDDSSHSSVRQIQEPLLLSENKLSLPHSNHKIMKINLCEYCILTPIYCKNYFCK